MQIKLAILGKSTSKLDFTENVVTVDMVLKRANIVLREDKKTNEKDEVLLNGEKITDLTTRVIEGGIVTVVPKVKGGQ
jgi:hypothetical protein